LLAIISGAPPDLMWLEGSGVIEFAYQGLLADLTDTLAGLNFVPADTQEMTYDGRIWAVPYHTTSRGLFKNVDYFHATISHPWPVESVGFFLRRRPSRRSLEARTWRPCVHPVIKAHEIQ